MAPRILIFSMAMGADYTFELISIETYKPQFNGHNKLVNQRQQIHGGNFKLKGHVTRSVSYKSSNLFGHV